MKRETRAKEGLLPKVSGGVFSCFQFLQSSGESPTLGWKFLGDIGSGLFISGSFHSRNSRLAAPSVVAIGQRISRL